MTTPQQPLGSGFGFHSTAAEVAAGLDFTGKVAIVTGGYSGIGLETTRVLAQAGATVVVPSRDPAKARRALEGIPGVQQQPLDLQDPGSIDAFARDFAGSGRPLHVLINNAAIMATPLARDARGYESQLSTNHIGHFQLVQRLWPALQRAGGARVVALSSGAHRRAAFDFDDPHFNHRPYDPWTAYGQSKTATALLAVALDTRGQADGIRAFSVHPGRILTALQRHLSLQDLQAMGWRDSEGRVPAALAHLYKTVQQGAATTLWCAIHPMLEGRGGVYCEDCDIAQAVSEDLKTLDGVLPWACDPQLAGQLWKLSEQLIR